MVRMCRVVLSVLVLLAAAACTASRPAAPAAAPPPLPPAPAPDPAAVAADELGEVPILMYHQLSPAPAGEYDQTPEEFRAELDRLYREGYRPVTAAQYSAGEIDLPAGTHPVVLTFDDSTVSQVAFAPDGAPAPGTVVGILTEFTAQHPDFRATATFYVNDDAFGNDPRALPWLAAHGYDLGAHTATHANLGTLDATGVQRELASNLRTIRRAVPNAPVRTMALPLGISPADPALATAGTWDGTSYTFDAVMLVGSEPAPSPYGPLDPAAIPRIRSGRAEVPFDSAYWLNRLAEHPERRYTSDGDPHRISFPATRSGDLSPRWAARAHPY
ncbi:polysaccharide deacetylase family protein [Nocardia blacklockiae]|uniref:polysaccharide deacetylase family protein n=1 Tax=Nocardia blacklockiae TaxID=480036 RepID=UPI0018931694|nr:polysaccharide deacetylase family protein [Nocardia blacklockiae]MBF6170708.1 polysaccharide deacetylase family protein [Nocardia blacklockiae]